MHCELCKGAKTKNDPIAVSDLELCLLCWCWLGCVGKLQQHGKQLPAEELFGYSMKDTMEIPAGMCTDFGQPWLFFCLGNLFVIVMVTKADSPK